MSKSNALTDHDWIIAAAGNDYLRELACALPERGHGPGRRRTYRVFVGLLYILTAGGITGSHRSAAQLLGSETAWRAVRLAHRKAKGATEEALPRRAPSRGQPETLRKHLAKHVDLIREHARALAVRQARAADCFAPTGSATDLRRSDMLIGDGKVVAALILSKTVERWLAQGRPIDTGLHKQAGETSGVYVIGSKFLLMGVRASEARNARILLDIAYLPPGGGYGGEAGAATSTARRLQQMVSDCGGNVGGICYDGALRAAHIDPLIKSGLVVLSPVHQTAAARTRPQLPLRQPAPPGGQRRDHLRDPGHRHRRTAHHPAPDPKARQTAQPKHREVLPLVPRGRTLLRNHQARPRRHHRRGPAHRVQTSRTDQTARPRQPRLPKLLRIPRRRGELEQHPRPNPLRRQNDRLHRQPTTPPHDRLHARQEHPRAPRPTTTTNNSPAPKPAAPTRHLRSLPRLKAAHNQKQTSNRRPAPPRTGLRAFSHFRKLREPRILIPRPTGAQFRSTKRSSPVGEYIRTQRELAQVSLRQLAQRAGVSNPYLSQIERGLRNPSAQVMGQIARALRLSAEAIDTQAEILAECDPSRVRGAVLADESITERQKEALIQVYEAFVQEALRTRELHDQPNHHTEGD